MLYLEILIMAILIIYGLKMGGSLSVGILSLLGVFLMVFVFKLPLGSAPILPVMIIFSIGIAGGMLEASGGLSYLVHIAGKVIKKAPGAITFVAPLIVFGFVFGVGTTNITLSLEPIIAKTALKAGVRPERPLVACVIAANFAVVCSPAAAATIIAFGFVSSYGYSLAQYLMVVLPSALAATVAVSVFMNFRGKPLAKDPEYQRRIAEGLINHSDIEDKDEQFTKKQKLSLAAFLVCVFFVLLFGLHEELFHSMINPTLINNKTVFMSPSDTVQIFMYVAAALIMFITKMKPAAIYKTKIFPAAVGAALAVLGPGWLGATIFNAPVNSAFLHENLSHVIGSAPWVIVFVIALVATFVMSQSSIISIIYPLALGLGVPAGLMVAIIQAVNVNFFIPAIPTMLFAEEIDQTGSTQRYRFWLPGSFAVLFSMGIGVLIWKTML